MSDELTMRVLEAEKGKPILLPEIYGVFQFIGNDVLYLPFATKLDYETALDDIEVCFENGSEVARIHGAEACSTAVVVKNLMCVTPMSSKTFEKVMAEGQL